jgi:hypothetical protein
VVRSQTRELHQVALWCFGASSREGRDGQMGGTARPDPARARLGHGPFGPFNSRAGTTLVPEARPKHGTKPA